MRIQAGWIREMALQVGGQADSGVALPCIALHWLALPCIALHSSCTPTEMLSVSYSPSNLSAAFLRSLSRDNRDMKVSDHHWLAEQPQTGPGTVTMPVFSKSCRHHKPSGSCSFCLASWGVRENKVKFVRVPNVRKISKE